MTIEKSNEIYKIKNFLIKISKERIPLTNTDSNDNNRTYKIFSSNKLIEVLLVTRQNNQKLNSKNNGKCIHLLLGDDTEVQNIYKNKFLANCIIIKIDLCRNSIELHTSIVGLPPIYFLETKQFFIITSDIHLLSKEKEIELTFDYKSVYELGFIGHPVDYRTLFKNLKMVEPGSRLYYSEYDGLSITKGWSFKFKNKEIKREEYLRQQIETFDNIIRTMNLSDNFLSLTAGLDTRAIFAGIIKDGINIPAFTITGKRHTLDARIAKKLCQNYGYKHNLITLGKSFIDELPYLSYESSKLSGGLSSLKQAHEVYFYKKIPNFFKARLSGNLGNQIGRFGTEGVSLRNAEMDIINKDILLHCDIDNSHWFKKTNLSNIEKYIHFLLQKEIPFSSAANYTIGNNFLVQKSPYANYQLIEIAENMPFDLSVIQGLSIRNIHFNDLKHRFIGESDRSSFQMKYIKNVGGYVAQCPINWGMNANRTITLYGLFYGGLSIMDIMHAKKGNYNKAIKRMGEILGVTGVHIFYPTADILFNRLKDFVFDTLLSQNIVDSSVFNKNNLRKEIAKFYASKGKNENTLLYALDIAIAMQEFKAKI